MTTELDQLLELFAKPTQPALRKNLTMGDCLLLRAAVANRHRRAELLDVLKQCNLTLTNLTNLLKITHLDNAGQLITIIDCNPLLKARLRLMEAVTGDCTRDLAETRIRQLVHATKLAWNYNRIGLLESVDKLLGDPNAGGRKPSFWPVTSDKQQHSLSDVLSTIAAEVGWSDPGILMAGEIIAELLDGRPNPKLTVRTQLMFAAYHPEHPQGILAELTVQAIPNGCGLLIPDPYRCGYLHMQADFSNGLQRSLIAARNFAFEHFKLSTQEYDWRWSLDLHSAIEKYREKPIQFPLQGPSAEVAIACALIAAHPANPDNAGNVDPLDIHVSATASLTDPRSVNSPVQGVGQVKVKTLVDRVQVERIQEIVLAEAQDKSVMPQPTQDARFEFREAKNLGEAYRLMTRRPRITRGVNAYFKNRAELYLQKYCTPYVLPELREVDETEKHLGTEVDTRSKKLKTCSVEDFEQLIHGRLRARIPTQPASSLPSESNSSYSYLGHRVRIFADSGLGKSMLILHCESRIATDGEFVPLRLGRTTPEDSTLDIRWNQDSYDDVIALLSESPQLTAAFHHWQRDAKQDSLSKREWFEWMVQHGRVVFLIDALDQANEQLTGMGRFFGSEKLHLCPVIMTGRPESLLNRPEAFLGIDHWRTMRLQPFNRDRREEYLGTELSQQLLLPPEKDPDPNDDDLEEMPDQGIDWQTSPEEMRLHHWRPLLRIPLLLHLIKQLAISSDGTDSLNDINSRFQLYDIAVKHLITKGYQTASEQQKSLLVDESTVREILGRIAWFMIRQRTAKGEVEHRFSAILDGEQFKKFVKSSLEGKPETTSEFVKALQQVDLTTSLQILEGVNNSGLVFRHRSFMEFFAASHLMSTKADKIDPDTGECKIEPRIPESLKLDLLAEIHQITDDSGQWIPERFDRVRNWSDTLRFALAYPDESSRDWLARQLIQHGNPWIVYQAIKRDQTRFKPQIESLCRWLVHQDYPDWFDFTNAVTEAAEPAEVKQIASGAIRENAINVDRTTQRRTRDAAYLSALRELLPTAATWAYVDSSERQNSLDRIAHLQQGTGDVGRKSSWDFEQSFVSLSGGMFQLNEFHPKLEQSIHLRAFELADFPVTNQLFELFCPSHRRQRDERHSPHEDSPVIHVSWHMASEFCTWLSELTGRVYRLPTEWEWEWACRWLCGKKGEQHRKKFWWGPTESIGIEQQLCWMYKSDVTSTRTRSETVAAYDIAVVKHSSWRSAQNPGLLDMSGNVWEWCSNWYSEPGSGRVVRGGSWLNDARGCASSYRRVDLPENRSSLIGFRVCRA